MALALCPVELVLTGSTQDRMIQSTLWHQSQASSFSGMTLLKPCKLMTQKDEENLSFMT
jgi:hypothetical protein